MRTKYMKIFMEKATETTRLENKVKRLKRINRIRALETEIQLEEFKIEKDIKLRNLNYTCADPMNNFIADSEDEEMDRVVRNVMWKYQPLAQLTEININIEQ